MKVNGSCHRRSELSRSGKREAGAGSGQRAAGSGKREAGGWKLELKLRAIRNRRSLPIREPSPDPFERTEPKPPQPQTLAIHSNSQMARTMYKLMASELTEQSRPETGEQCRADDRLQT